MSAGSSPTSKSPGQRDHILSMLRAAGSAGVGNTELNRVCFGYGARIWELRRASIQIRTVRESEGVFRFILDRQSDQSQPFDTCQKRTRQLEAETLPLFALVVRS